MPEKPDLGIWESILVHPAGGNPAGGNISPARIDLTIPYRCSCELRSDGTMDMQTQFGASHGDPGGRLGPVQVLFVLHLVVDAVRIGRHYWGGSWGGIVVKSIS